MSDCIFCKIANKEIPTQAVYEDDMVIAFNDLEPQAPVHVLVIPKKHIASLLATTAEDKELLAHITCEVIPMLAKKLNIAENGFRTVVNTGEEGAKQFSTFISTYLAVALCNGHQADKKSYQICI